MKSLRTHSGRLLLDEDLAFKYAQKIKQKVA